MNGNSELVASEHGEIISTQKAPFMPSPIMKAADFVAAKTYLKSEIKAILVEGVDYSVLPGTKANFLEISGVSSILTFMGCYAKDEIIDSKIDPAFVNKFDAGKWIPDPDDERTKAEVQTLQAERDALKAAGLGRWRQDDKKKWVFQKRMDEIGESLGFYSFVARSNIYHAQTGTLLASAIGICSTVETKYVRDPGASIHTVMTMAAKRARALATKAAFGLNDLFADEDAELAESKSSYGKTPSKGSGSVNEGMNPADSVAPTIWAPKGWAVFKRDMGLTDDLTREIEALAKTANQNMPNLSKAYQTEVGENGTCTAAGFLTWVKNELAPEGGQD